MTYPACLYFTCQYLTACYVRSSFPLSTRHLSVTVTSASACVDLITNPLAVGPHAFTETNKPMHGFLTLLTGSANVMSGYVTRIVFFFPL